VKLVPTMQLDPTSVNKTNIGQVMLKAKYYTVAQMEK
jgi:ABC-type xylose transport system substrate-binding protein